VYGKGAKPKDDKRNFEAEKPSWGFGSATNTNLEDENGTVQAWYKTKTVFEVQERGLPFTFIYQLEILFPLQSQHLLNNANLWSLNSYLIHD